MPDLAKIAYEAYRNHCWEHASAAETAPLAAKLTEWEDLAPACRAAWDAVAQAVLGVDRAA